MNRFVAFAQRAGVDDLAAVDADLVHGFVSARLQSGMKAGVATMHERRSTVRLLFRVARRLELVSTDPTLDVVLPPRDGRPLRPLVDDEIELCRDVALWSLGTRRLASVWAIAEATGRGAELARVTASDVDLEGRRVRLHGGKRTTERWGDLSSWGVSVLRGRLEEVAGHDSLTYSGEGSGIAGQVSTCSAISTVLVRAGLAGEPGVRPMSVAAWAGRQAFDAGEDIAGVACRLGVRSLDQAASLIGWNWKL